MPHTYTPQEPPGAAETVALVVNESTHTFLGLKVTLLGLHIKSCLLVELKGYILLFHCQCGNAFIFFFGGGEIPVSSVHVY